MRFSTLFFDLDDTLYNCHSGLWEGIRDRMNLYMQERMGLDPDEVKTLRHHYYVTYGTTLRGLQKHCQVDVDDYLAYVHDLPLEQYIDPDPAMRELLQSLPQRKWVFTNADTAHAERVLARVELADLFDGIIDIRATGFFCKPEPGAYERAMKIAGVQDPHECVMFDDSARNLAPAQALGFTTVLVRPVDEIAGQPTAHFQLPSLLSLRSAMPELWPDGGKRI